MNLLDEKVALVTGSARGNGAGIARELALHGADVVLTDIDEAGVHSQSRLIESETGRQTRAIVGDISSRSETEAIIDAILKEWGRIDILVNNAGILLRHTVLELTKEEWDRTLSVNLTGSLQASQLVAKHMVEAGSGSIINITSMASELAPPNQTAYCVSKGGLQMLTRAMAVELAPRNVRVNAVAPAVILTEMTRPMYDTDDKVARILERIPMGRFGTPTDVAGAVVFLASHLAAYVTGATIFVDGGYMVR